MRIVDQTKHDKWISLSLSNDARSGCDSMSSTWYWSTSDISCRLNWYIFPILPVKSRDLNGIWIEMTQMSFCHPMHILLCGRCVCVCSIYPLEKSNLCGVIKMHTRASNIKRNNEPTNSWGVSLHVRVVECVCVCFLHAINFVLMLLLFFFSILEATCWLSFFFM